MTIERGLRLAAGVVVLLSVSTGLFCPSGLAIVDGLCGAESTAIGIHKLVPDGVDSGPAGTPALRSPSNSTNTDRPLSARFAYSAVSLQKERRSYDYSRNRIAAMGSAERRSSFSFGAGVIVLLLWLAGKFSPKVPVKNATAQTQGLNVAAAIGAGTSDPTASVRIGSGNDSCRP